MLARGLSYQHIKYIHVCAAGKCTLSGGNACKMNVVSKADVASKPLSVLKMSAWNVFRTCRCLIGLSELLVPAVCSDLTSGFGSISVKTVISGGMWYRAAKWAALRELHETSAYIMESFSIAASAC